MKTYRSDCCKEKVAGVFDPNNKQIGYRCPMCGKHCNIAMNRDMNKYQLWGEYFRRRSRYKTQHTEGGEGMKTKQMHLTGKEACEQMAACGECFSLVEQEDKYCWSCGAEFDEECAYSREDFMKEKV